MELFVLDRDPRVAAQMLSDADVLGKIVGVAQLLGSAYLKFDDLSYDDRRSEWTTSKGRRLYCPYEDAASNPLVGWVCEAPGNYSYVRRHLDGLLREYQRRWGDEKGKRHKTWEVYDVLREMPRLMRCKFLNVNRDTMTAFRAPNGMVWSHTEAKVDPVVIHRMIYQATRAGKAEYRKGTPEFMLEAEFGPPISTKYTNRLKREYTNPGYLEAPRIRTGNPEPGDFDYDEDQVFLDFMGKPF